MNPDLRARVSQGGEEPDAGAAAAAGRGVPGLSARRSGEGAQKKGGAGAKKAGGRSGTSDAPSRGEEAEGEQQKCLENELPVSFYENLWRLN